MKRILSIAVVCSLLGGVVSMVQAEVSARTDRRGTYLGTRIIPAGGDADPLVWSPRVRGGRRSVALNPDGDLNGDLWPHIAEPKASPRHPWLVWSRSNGSALAMAWSRWTGDRWDPVSWVSDRSPSNPGDDLDAHMVFDDTGRPYLVWWRDRDEAPDRVFLSVFLESRWMRPFRVSTMNGDARHPEIVAIQGTQESGLEIRVQFQTEEGAVVQPVLFSDPDTITDDINPQGRLSRGEVRAVDNRP